MGFEIDYLMRLDESGVMSYSGDEAAANTVEEWLRTPKGHVYGRPEWGNELALFKHEPPNEDTAVALENSILLGMIPDMPHLQIRGILCEPDNENIDVYRVQIATQAGYISTTYKL